jgi:hypothetical protein
MLFDVFFLGLPLAAAACLINIALKDGNRNAWTCAFSFIAYSVFYLAGGREVLLYICCYMLAGHSWVSVGGPAAAP